MGSTFADEVVVGKSVLVIEMPFFKNQMKFQLYELCSLDPKSI